MPLDPEFAAEIAQQLYGLRAIAKPLPGELDDNFKLEDSDGNHFILKIAHPDADVKYLAFQNDLLLHLDGKGLNTQVQAVVPTIEGTFIGTATDPEGRSRYVRLLTWVPGSLWAGLKYRSEELLFSLGAACGSLCAVLEGFDHPGAHRQLKWDLLQAEWTAPHLDAIEEEEVREQATAFLAAFRRQVLPQLPSLRKSVIHNDANDYNVLVDGDPGNQRVSGIIDFGDAVYTATVCDLAIAITYGVMGCREPLEAAVQIVRGFNEAYPLRENELALLHTLMEHRENVWELLVPGPEPPWLDAWRPWLSGAIRVFPEHNGKSLQEASRMIACGHWLLPVQLKTCFKTTLLDQISSFSECFSASRWLLSRRPRQEQPLCSSAP